MYELKGLLLIGVKTQNFRGFIGLKKNNKLFIFLEREDYAEYLINPLNYFISWRDEGIILSPSQEEVNSFSDVAPQFHLNHKYQITALSDLQIKNYAHECRGNLIHDHYLMRECIFVFI